MQSNQTKQYNEIAWDVYELTHSKRLYQMNQTELYSLVSWLNKLVVLLKAVKASEKISLMNIKTGQVSMHKRSYIAQQVNEVLRSVNSRIQSIEFDIDDVYEASEDDADANPGAARQRVREALLSPQYSESRPQEQKEPELPSRGKVDTSKFSKVGDLFKSRQPPVKTERPSGERPVKTEPTVKTERPSGERARENQRQSTHYIESVVNDPSPIQGDETIDYELKDKSGQVLYRLVKPEFDLSKVQPEYNLQVLKEQGENMNAAEYAFMESVSDLVPEDQYVASMRYRSQNANDWVSGAIHKSQMQEVSESDNTLWNIRNTGDMQSLEAARKILELNISPRKKKQLIGEILDTSNMTHTGDYREPHPFTRQIESPWKLPTVTKW